MESFGKIISFLAILLVITLIFGDKVSMGLMVLVIMSMLLINQEQVMEFLGT